MVVVAFQAQWFSTPLNTESVLGELENFQAIPGLLFQHLLGGGIPATLFLKLLI